MSSGFFVTAQYICSRLSPLKCRDNPTTTLLKYNIISDCHNIQKERQPEHRHTQRNYFTNADRVKKEDPYATLGLTWGATVTEIKTAYKQKARELHPDVSSLPPMQAQKEFQRIQSAFDKLVNLKNDLGRDDLTDEYSFQVWRKGDIISQNRTDVAGVLRKRPAKPANAENKSTTWGIAALGHPDQKGVRLKRGELIEDGTAKKSSTVGTGRNKWVKPKEFKPWNPKNKITLNQ